VNASGSSCTVIDALAGGAALTGATGIGSSIVVVVVVVVGGGGWSTVGDPPGAACVSWSEAGVESSSSRKLATLRASYCGSGTPCPSESPRETSPVGTPPYGCEIYCWVSACHPDPDEDGPNISASPPIPPPRASAPPEPKSSINEAGLSPSTPPR